MAISPSIGHKENRLWRCSIGSLAGEHKVRHGGERSHILDFGHSHARHGTLRTKLVQTHTDIHTQEPIHTVK